MQVGILTNTHLKEIQGATMNSKELKQCVVTARFTSDKHGETLSLSVDEDKPSGYQIIVPYEAVANLIAETRKDRNRKKA